MMDDDGGQELGVAEPRRRDICNINNSSDSLGCRPFLLQLPGGRRVRVDSVQSALRLYSRISSRSVPQQQLGGVPRPIAQRIFLRRGWTGRSSITSISVGGGIFAQLRFPSTFSAVMPPPLVLVRGRAGADGAIVLSTPAAAVGLASRVFSTCPLLLPGLSSTTAGGGTQTVLSLQQQLLTLPSTASVFSGSSGAIGTAVWYRWMSASQRSVAARWVSEAMCGPLEPSRGLGAFGTIHGPLAACWWTAAVVAAAARPAVVARAAVTGDTGAAFSPCTPSSTGECTVDAYSVDTSEAGDRFSRGGSVPAISPADWALPAWGSALSSSSSSGAREGADKTGAAASTVGEQPSCPMLASLSERLESGPVPSAFGFAGRGRGCPPHLSASPTFSGTAAGTATEDGAAAAAARTAVVARVAVTGDTGAAFSPCTPSSTGECTVDAYSVDTSEAGDRFSRGGSVPAISPADWALPAWGSALSSSSSSGAREGADKTGAAASTVGEQPSCPMLASLSERLESGPVPSAFGFAGRGRGCPPHLSASPTFSGIAAGTATEHGAAAAAAAAGAVPAAAYGACASYSGYASHAGGDRRGRYVLENMDLLDAADENKGAAAAASRKDDDDGKMKTDAIYGNQSVDQSGAEVLMGIGGRSSLQVMRVSGLDAALKPSSGSSDCTQEEEASPTESKKMQRHRCEELDTDEDYLAKIDPMTEEVSSLLQKTLTAAVSVAPPTPPLTPASTMSSPADSFHGSTRAVFFGSGYNENDSGAIFESVNEDSLLYLGVVAEDGWVPNEEARAKLDQLGQPLSFFMAQSDERDDDTLSFEEKGVSLR
ncbi:unnamed protein product [Ectocarpus sp. CCAP 1310/34]|nr:unnamed protein product [Ectocarpus sp. CCAP 1310/34]